MRTVRHGRLAGIFLARRPARGPHNFVTTATEELALDWTGIAGDLHGGQTRRAGAREPWLPRGLVLRNDRQLSALCPQELARIAAALGLPAVAPEWLGANLLVEGFPEFSRMAPGTRLAIGGNWAGKGRFDGDVVLQVEGYNAPCRQAGRAVAALSGRPEAELGFVKAGSGLRGLVLSVAAPGTVRPGDPMVAIPPPTAPIV